jgi:hypothetical protein
MRFNLHYIILLLFAFVIIVPFYTNASEGEILDNTKKRIIIVNVGIYECYQNDTGCVLIQMSSNKTDMGSIGVIVNGTRL